MRGIYSNYLKEPRCEPARRIPPAVANRAKSAGAVGEAWLANLDKLICLKILEESFRKRLPY